MLRLMIALMVGLMLTGCGSLGDGDNTSIDCERREGGAYCPAPYACDMATKKCSRSCTEIAGCSEGFSCTRSNGSSAKMVCQKLIPHHEPWPCTPNPNPGRERGTCANGMVCLQGEKVCRWPCKQGACNGGYSCTELSGAHVCVPPQS